MPRLSSIEELENLRNILAVDIDENQLCIVLCGGTACDASGSADIVQTVKKYILENDLMAEHETQSLGPLKQQGMLIKLSETPGNLQRSAPALGQHTDEILAELGYSEESIQQMRENRIIL